MPNFAVVTSPAFVDLFASNTDIEIIVVDSSYRPASEYVEYALGLLSAYQGSEALAHIQEAIEEELRSSLDVTGEPTAETFPAFDELPSTLQNWVKALVPSGFGPDEVQLEADIVARRIESQLSELHDAVRDENWPVAKSALRQAEDTPLLKDLLS